VGTVLLVVRLAVRDVRRHAAQAALLVVAIAAAAATLTMGLAMSGVTTQHPYAETRAATKGPDVVAYVTSLSQATSLIHASGVAASGGPFPVVSGIIRFEGRQADVFAEGRSAAPSSIDRPLLTAGNWVRPGGIVIQRTFADALAVSVGDRVSVNGQKLTVAGIAVTAAQSPYPNLCNGTLIANTPQASKFSSACSFPSFKIPFLSLSGRELSSSDDVGEIWMTESNAIALTSKTKPLTTYVVNLKLTNPNDAQAFAWKRTSPASIGPNAPLFSTWEGLASEDAILIQDGHSVIEPGAVLLALLAIASVAVLVGRRLSEYAPRVGLLKAVGGTPSMVAATFLVENLALALFAAVVGLVTGWLASPLITQPGTALIGAAGSPPLALSTVVEVIGVALIVALAATLVPSIRAARSGTVDSLNDVAGAPRRRGLLVKISRRLPVPAQFGLRLVARRPRRALLSTANVAVTVTGIVTVIAFHAFADAKLTGSALTAGGLSNPVINRDEQMLTIITIMLVALAVLNAIFTTWATVLDARRSSALMRALGARVRQVSGGLIVAQVLSALPGAIIGVPLGLLLFKVAVHGATFQPTLFVWLAATVVGTLTAMAALTFVPALIGARQSVAQVLQSEVA
jgi:ABC-type lipoprotein release transport system permease subunit